MHTRKALISIGLTVLAVTFLMGTQCYASPIVEVIGKTGSEAAEIEIHIPSYTNKLLAQGGNPGKNHIIVKARTNILCTEFADFKVDPGNFVVIVLLKNQGRVAEGEVF